MVIYREIFVFTGHNSHYIVSEGTQVTLGSVVIRGLIIYYEPKPAKMEQSFLFVVCFWI
jgi:hypothetical protein